eukprot:75059_1
MSFTLVINVILLHTPTPTVSTSVVIDTDYGLIEGLQYESINMFAAIPYAKPPVNELRFAPPQSMEPWNDTFMADDYSARVSCPQTSTKLTKKRTMSEDCLLLNIYTPSNAKESTTNYAVLIWIHSGAFQHGYAGYVDDMFNVIEYIKDIIIVTINYRLGILGSLYDNTYSTGLEGNYGFLDQKLAIKWIYDNIAYFGGDPTQIVLFGSSAGAYSIGLHLLYNNEHIAGGIMQSPPFGLPLRDPITWFNVPQVFSSRVGCHEYAANASALLDCWRSVSWQTIVDLQSYSLSNIAIHANWNFFMSFTPTAHTQTVPHQAIFEWRNASIADKIPPFIIGHTRDEGFGFMSKLKDYDMVNYNMLYAIFEMFFSGDAGVLDEVLDYYGIRSDTQDLYSVTSKQFGDFAFDCAIRNISHNSMHNDVFYYQFNVIQTSQSSKCFNKSCHAYEKAYLFERDYENETYSIGDILKMYWSNFAKYLNPNEAAIGNKWERFCANMETMRMSNDNYTANSMEIQDEYNKKCEFWDHIGYAGVYCTDCDYVPSSNIAFKIQQCSDVELETTDSTEILSERQSTDSMDDHKTTKHLNVIIIAIAVVVVMLSVGVITFIFLVWTKRAREFERDDADAREDELEETEHLVAVN